jgi:hypothetical protein
MLCHLGYKIVLRRYQLLLHALFHFLKPLPFYFLPSHPNLLYLQKTNPIISLTIDRNIEASGLENKPTITNKHLHFLRDLLFITIEIIGEFGGVTLVLEPFLKQNNLESPFARPAAHG